MNTTRTKRLENMLAELQRRNRPSPPAVLYARTEGGFTADGIIYDSVPAFVARHGLPPLVIVPAPDVKE